MLRNRKYKSGSIWALWRWTDVDSEYIVRLHVIKTPWWAICVHWIIKPDPEPWLHDHPVSFFSLVLKGWYTEKRVVDKFYTGFTPTFRSINHTNRITGSDWDRHSIVQVAPEGAVTLCFMGPKTREWGFHTPDGWVMWKDYYTKQRAEKD
jgi:hypothetical protein